jgi:hypothetical protein
VKRAKALGSNSDLDASSSFSFVVLLGRSFAGNVVTLSLFLGKHVVGFLERNLEAVLEGVEGLVSETLGLVATGLSSLGSEELLAVGVSLLGGLLDKLVGLGSEGVESTHKSLVGERVLLVLAVSADVVLDVSEDGLDRVGVDDSGDISALHDGSVDSVTLLLSGVLVEVTEDLLEGGETTLGEDEESTEVTTRGELEDVESVNIADIDTGDVSSGLGELSIGIIVDDEGTLGHDVSGSSELADTNSGVAGVLDLEELVTGTELGEGIEEILGLGGGVETVDDKGELRDVVDLVATGHHERSASRRGKSRSDGVSSHGDVALSVPLSPDLEGSEHTRLSAHVTEGSLTSTGSTGTGNSRNTGDGSTGTPGLGGVLSTSLVEDGVTLSSVLSEVGVNEMDEVVSDGNGKDIGHGSGLGGSTRGVPDGDGRSSGHFCFNKELIIILEWHTKMN